ncbi:MAG: anaerobic ribonucleoside-triphosphate reductase, partial [Oscillospiraceae bacterium]|nr:anaerobic ribonucleoside-triphosphate reductase [Oscillospiraceae bacterium]
EITELSIKTDGDYADLQFKFADIPFDRIRRITGYLVGTIDRFNNAKRSEVNDRVKHDV